MDTTLVQRDQMRSRIAQLEHEEAVAARDYPRSAFRGPRQEELGQLRRSLMAQREVWFRLEHAAGGWTAWVHEAVSEAVWSRLLALDAEGLAEVQTTDPRRLPVPGAMGAREEGT